MSRGVWIFILMITIVGFMVLLAALNLRRPIHLAPASRVLVFDVPDQIQESERRYRVFSSSHPVMRELVSGLRRAAGDESIASLVVHVDDVSWGWAKMREVRDAMLEFRRAGKPIYVSLGWGGDAEYYLASVGDVIAVPPATVLQIDGLSASVMFYRGTFDKLGVSPHFARVGAYKSAPETYTQRSMSGPMQEALDALLDDQFAELVEAIASERGMAPEAVRQTIDDGPYTSETALARGLIDTVCYKSELEEMATHHGDDERSTVSLERYAARGETSKGTRIAMIVTEGTIAPGKSNEWPWEDPVAGAETIGKALDQAREQRSIKAIVLRIDSPGGSLPASDEIWRSVQRAAAEKPVIVSMSNVAASGGYYIAAPATWIVAEPTTLTGSIGVYAGKFNVRGLYEKLGLDIESLSRGEHANMTSPFQDFTPEEARRFQSQVEDGYRLFLMRVSEGRKLDTEAADAAGQGRVWSGARALERGLVDELGGIETAFRAALDELGLAEDAPYVVETFPKVRRTFLQGLVEDLIDEQSVNVVHLPDLPPVARSWLTAARLRSGTSLALLPFSVEIR